MIKKKVFFAFLLCHLLPLSVYSLPRNPVSSAAPSYRNDGDYILPLALSVTSNTVATVDSSELADRRRVSLQLTGFSETRSVTSICVSTSSNMTCTGTSIALAILSTATLSGGAPIATTEFEDFSNSPLYLLMVAGSSGTATVRGGVWRDQGDDGDD